MRYTYKQPNIDYSRPQEETSGDYYQAIETDTYCEITEANYYPNLLINRAYHKGGTYQNSKGKTISYEYLSLELVDDKRYIKTWATIFFKGRDTDRLDELVTLLELKDEHGNPGFRFTPAQTQEKGKINEFVEDIQGKRIDAILYDFEYDDKGYIKYKIEGFFLNGLSAREYYSHIQQQDARDVKTCMSWMGNMVGTGVKPQQYGTPSVPVTNDVQIQNNAAYPQQMAQAPYPQQPAQAPVPQQMAQPAPQNQRRQRTPLPRQQQNMNAYAQAQQEFYQNAGYPQSPVPPQQEPDIPF